MRLLPSRTKYRKSHRGSRAGNAKGNTSLAFGDYGIQAIGRGWMTAAQVEAARVAITRNMKRRGKVWIRVFPGKPISKKPAETRMGKGKGSTEFWAAEIGRAHV